MTIEYDRELVAFMGLSGGRQGVIAGSSVDQAAGEVAITFFRESPDDGDQLRLHWVMDEDAPNPVVVSASAFHADGSAANGVISLGSMSEDDGPEPVAFSSDLSGFSAGADATAACVGVAYPSAVADVPLGDLDESGSVDVKDVMRAHSLLAGDQLDVEDAFELFHADPTGDCSYDERDVEQLFMKAAVADLAAAPVLKPRVLTYQDLLSDRPVVVGNAGNEPLPDVAFYGTNLNGTALDGSLTRPVEGQTAVWTYLGDPNDALGTLSVTAGEVTATVPVGNIAILIAGQSNAVGWDNDIPGDLQDPSGFPEVWMLGNDYEWRLATEPLDDPTEQEDTVSMDASTDVGTSVGTQLGRLLNGTTHRSAYLIPSAFGGSRVTLRPEEDMAWRYSDADLLGTDTSTLFGSAAYRGLASAGIRNMPHSGQPNAQGGPVSAVFWYQGESDTREGHGMSGNETRSAYAASTADVFEAFQTHFSTEAVDTVVIYAQLAPFSVEPGTDSITGRRRNRQFMDIAERQRRLETDAPYLGTAALDGGGVDVTNLTLAYMVVTNDLAMSDHIHLSSQGQTMLAERVALAYQEHVLGLNVDGTGPRLASVTRVGYEIRVRLDRPVKPSSISGPHGYSGYFSAWDGAPNPGDVDLASYGQNNGLAISNVERDPGDPHTVIVTISPSETITSNVYLRYMRPHVNANELPFVEDVVRGLDSGLPLPSFGPLLVD